MTLSDISNCIVNLLHDHTTDFSAVHLQRVSDSVLLLPHINGSILLHDMSNCVLVVGCHQVQRKWSLIDDKLNRGDWLSFECTARQG